MASFLLAVLALQQTWAAPKPPAAVKLKTSDGWTLAASYRAPRKGRPVAVLAHGFAAGKGEWLGFSEELARQGWGALALDLRGHGESVEGPRGKTTLEFMDATTPWTQAALDLDAAIVFLKTKGIAQTRIGLIGASLGANLVSIVAARNPKLRCAVLLSPGRDYRGVFLEEKIGPRTLAAASSSDPYAAQTLVGFQARESQHVRLSAARGHGVQMFNDPVFLKKLLDWLTRG